MPTVNERKVIEASIFLHTYSRYDREHPWVKLVVIFDEHMMFGRLQVEIYTRTAKGCGYNKEYVFMPKEERHRLARERLITPREWSNPGAKPGLAEMATAAMRRWPEALVYTLKGEEAMLWTPDHADAFVEREEQSLH